MSALFCAVGSATGTRFQGWLKLFREHNAPAFGWFTSRNEKKKKQLVFPDDQATSRNIGSGANGRP
jgi:hypothetical protein